MPYSILTRAKKCSWHSHELLILPLFLILVLNVSEWFRTAVLKLWQASNHLEGLLNFTAGLHPGASDSVAFLTSSLEKLKPFVLGSHFNDLQFLCSSMSVSSQPSTVYIKREGNTTTTTAGRVGALGKFKPYCITKQCFFLVGHNNRRQRPRQILKSSHSFSFLSLAKIDSLLSPG